MKVLHCRDLGFDCNHVIESESEQEIVTQAAKHAQTVHGLEEISPAVVQAVQGAIQEK